MTDSRPRQQPDLRFAWCLSLAFAILSIGVFAAPSAAGEGAWEDIGESWQMASALGAKEIPNRVDNWGPRWEHDWPTWHRMLPQYLGELT